MIAPEILAAGSAPKSRAAGMCKLQFGIDLPQPHAAMHAEQAFGVRLRSWVR